MPGKPDKPHRIRVRVIDGKPRDPKELNKLKSNQLGMPHLDIVGTIVAGEFIICASKDTHVEQVRSKLGGAGLEEIAGGDTAIAAPNPTNTQAGRNRGSEQRGGPRHQQGSATSTQPLPGKPYGFVALPTEFTTAAPVWHDGGESSEGRLAGEIRFEIETLTPLLVGWERGLAGEDRDHDWPVPATLDGVGHLAAKKPVLCPLRAPWGTRPVIIPGDSLKGLLRHELGALLGAPMERVAERSYSYRPNMSFPDRGRPTLEPRLARVREMTTVDVGGESWPFPLLFEVLSMATRKDQTYYPRRERGSLIPPSPGAEPYKGGMGGGRPLPDAVLSDDARRKVIHTHLDVGRLPVEYPSTRVPPEVVEQYRRTLAHLVDINDGHFSARHPNAGADQVKQRSGNRAIREAAERAFQPGDLIWVEWDTERKQIVSLGWHYYYRWAYTDTVRRDADAPRLERHGLFSLDAEREKDSDGAPAQLSSVRRLFGYTGDNSTGIGKDDHTQLMGRVFVNAGLEVVGESDSDGDRFLKPTFLKELGMPRPSAVEHYLKQPHHPRSRPSDNATLVTYGDAADYDTPGELAGRKFYLDRKEAYTATPWEDASDTNRQNDRSTLALEASMPQRKFRFTVRFRDLDASELAAILVAFCPNQFKGVLGGTHTDGYCSKLGYARPLGWGSVHIEAKALLLLDEAGDTPMLKPEADLGGWVKSNHQETATQGEWLVVHCRKHPDAADYPRGDDSNVYSFHTKLRAEHSRNRRYKKDGAR